MEIFLLEKKGQVAAATAKAYAVCLRDFAAAVSDPASAVSAQIEGYLRALSQRATRPTLARSMTALRGYYRSLQRRGAREDDPTASLSPKDFSVLPSPASTQSAFAALMETPFQGIRGMRDRLMLLLLWQYSLSVGELLSLRRADLDPAAAVISGKKKQWPLSPALVRAFSEYTAVTALVAPRDTDFLFVNEKGEKLSRQGFWKSVKTRARRAGLSDEMSLQSLRLSKKK